MKNGKSRLLIAMVGVLLSLCFAFEGLDISCISAELIEAKAVSANRHALLIGVGKYNYDDKHTQVDLNTVSDVEAIKSVLKSPKYGFPEGSITVLTTPELTTRVAIITAFKSLIEKTQKGDLVYFHYSGHGSALPDKSQRKLSGELQTLVPHDYDVTLPVPCNEITDKELRDLVAALSAKSPLLVTMVF
ncbi:MAG: caspase family protein [Candidatus Obscuribacter sp.]|nr:caspase family protein [Candidatus Obscuribacter sp.]